MGEGNRLSSWGTVRTFAAKGTCSQTLYCVLDRAFGHPMQREESASDPLAGGIMHHGYQCGMIWGSTLAAGAEAHRRFGDGPVAQLAAVRAARRIVETFRAQVGVTDCREITGMNKSVTPFQIFAYFFLKGGVVGCFRMAARYAPTAQAEIESALTEKANEPHIEPSSCSALLLKKMGASGEHVVTSAGLAGGIGLSGGACGALGAAIWMTGVNERAEGRKVEYHSKSAQEILDRFLECTNNVFVCSRIVGHRFKDVADHAAYLREGGCAKIIDALASVKTPG